MKKIIYVLFGLAFFTTLSITLLDDITAQAPPPDRDQEFLDRYNDLKYYKTIDSRSLTPVQQELLEERWLVIIEPDGSELAYHLPKGLMDLLMQRAGIT